MYEVCELTIGDIVDPNEMIMRCPLSSVRPSAAILSTNPSHCYKVSRP